MQVCNSCGGIVGRDCFNTYECAQISAAMNAQYQVEMAVSLEMEKLQNEHDQLRRELEDTSMVAALQDDIRQMKRDIETLSCWIRLTWDTSEIPGFERTAKVLDVCAKYEEQKP